MVWQWAIVGVSLPEMGQPARAGALQSVGSVADVCHAIAINGTNFSIHGTYVLNWAGVKPDNDAEADRSPAGDSTDGMSMAAAGVDRRL
jgi:hypothetical protein